MLIRMTTPPFGLCEATTPCTVMQMETFPEIPIILLVGGAEQSYRPTSTDDIHETRINVHVFLPQQPQFHHSECGL